MSNLSRMSEHVLDSYITLVPILGITVCEWASHLGITFVVGCDCVLWCCGIAFVVGYICGAVTLHLWWVAFVVGLHLWCCDITFVAVALHLWRITFVVDCICGGITLVVL
jgi:hypothetical protein